MGQNIAQKQIHFHMGTWHSIVVVSEILHGLIIYSAVFGKWAKIFGKIKIQLGSDLGYKHRNLVKFKERDSSHTVGKARITP